MPQNQPERLGNIHTIAIVSWIVKSLDAEKDRYPLWIPVFLGSGVAVYFGQGSEPPAWVGWVLISGALSLLAAAGRSGLAGRLLALGVLCVGIGFAAAQMRTVWKTAPVLLHMSGAVQVKGTVSLVEQIADGGGERVTLDDVDFLSDEPLPKRVRLRFRDTIPGVEAGQGISIRATLLPPARPAVPGAYDFPRKAWFMELGATGMALAPAEILSEPDRRSWRIGLNRLRQVIADHIRGALPGPSGGVATAIVTGETSGIPPDVLAAYRNSGLAHILVIAGLHMGLLSGLVFFLVRGGLALFPAVALNFPIKKWAALAALAVTGGYMALAGFPVPATRAFIMAAAVLVAVLLDRGALSLRLWAFAASLILVIEPEQIVGPSFQMSFAAVAALIATYDVLGSWLSARRRDYDSWVGRAGLHLFRLGLTSFVAGTATMVYGLYHFNRIAVWQVIANLLAVPLVGLFIMPFALAALILMPVGLESWPLWVMGQGIDRVTDIGFWSANLPYAQIAMPPMPVWGLIVFSLGGLWLCLWRTRWRLLGLAPMAAGLASLALYDKPDLLVEEHGTVWGVRTGEDSLLISHGGRIVQETWGARAGPLAVAFWPKQGRSGDGRLSCDADWCLYRPPGHLVALVKTEQALSRACDGFDVVVSAVPVRDPCPGAKVVIDRFDLWRRGAHELWLKPDGTIRVETVAGWQGDRPWSFHPVPRHRPKPKEDEALEEAGPRIESGDLPSTK